MCLLLDMQVHFSLVEWRCDSYSVAGEHHNVNTRCRIVPKGSALYSLQDCILTSQSQTTLGICKPLVLKIAHEKQNYILFIFTSAEDENLSRLLWDCISNCPFIVPVHFFLWCLPHWFLGSLNEFLYFMHGQSRLSATESLDSFSSDKNYNTNCSHTMQSYLWTTTSHCSLYGVGNGLPWGLQWRKCNSCLYIPLHSDRVYIFITFLQAHFFLLNSSVPCKGLTISSLETDFMIIHVQRILVCNNYKFIHFYNNLPKFIKSFAIENSKILLDDCLLRCYF